MRYSCNSCAVSLQKTYVAGEEPVAFRAREDGLLLFRERAAFVFFLQYDVTIAPVVDPNAKFAARIHTVQLFPQCPIVPIVKIETADRIPACHGIGVRITWKYLSEPSFQPDGIRAGQRKLIFVPGFRGFHSFSFFCCLYCKLPM